MLALDRRRGVAGDRSDPDVGGQMSGGGEPGGVADFQQDPGGGPDPDSGHRDQDSGERVRIAYPLDLGGGLFALYQNGF
jgi:hypothetical protein